MYEGEHARPAAFPSPSKYFIARRGTHIVAALFFFFFFQREKASVYTSNVMRRQREVLSYMTPIHAQRVNALARCALLRLPARSAARCDARWRSNKSACSARLTRETRIFVTVVFRASDRHKEIGAHGLSMIE